MQKQSIIVLIENWFKNLEDINVDKKLISIKIQDETTIIVLNLF